MPGQGGPHQGEGRVGVLPRTTGAAYSGGMRRWVRHFVEGRAPSSGGQGKKGRSRELTVCSWRGVNGPATSADLMEVGAKLRWETGKRESSSNAEQPEAAFFMSTPTEKMVEREKGHKGAFRKRKNGRHRLFGNFERGSAGRRGGGWLLGGIGGWSPA